MTLTTQDLPLELLSVCNKEVALTSSGGNSLLFLDGNVSTKGWHCISYSMFPVPGRQ